MTQLEPVEAAATTDFARAVNLKYRLPTKYLVCWIALVLIVVVAAVMEPDTFSPYSIRLITALAGGLFVASLGQNLVVMVGSVDLSVPAIMTLSAAVNVHYLSSLGSVQAFLVGMVLCTGVGLLSGALISYLRLNALIVTLAINAIVAAVLTVWMGQAYSTSGAAPQWLQSIGKGSWLNVSQMLWIGLVLAAVTVGVLSRTRGGRRVAAVGSNRTAARMLGTRVNLVTVLVFGAANALYGLAGALLAGLVHTPDASLGGTYQLMTITAVAIAGTSFAGGPSSIVSLLGACLLLQVFTQFLTLENLSAGALSLVQGLLLVAAVSLNTLTQFGRQGFRRLFETFGSVRTRS